MNDTVEDNSSEVSALPDVEKIKKIKRISTWLVFFLSIVTVGFYTFYWLYKRTIIVNQSLDKEDRISTWLPIVTIVSAVLYLILTIVPLVFFFSINPDAASIMISMGTFFSFIYMIGFLVWLFKFRSRLNILSGSTSGEQFWLGGIFTFFFNILYFQWKINQMHDYV